MGSRSIEQRKSAVRRIRQASLLVLAIAVLLCMTTACKKKPGATDETAVTGTTSIQTANLAQDAWAGMTGYGLLPASMKVQGDLERPVTRAEFASLIVNGLPWDGPTTGQPSFADVPPDHSDYLAIEQTRELFSLNPTANAGDPNAPLPTFSPEGTLTRTEAVKILSTALDFDVSGQTLPESIKLPADDPIMMAGYQELLWTDASRLFYLLIKSRQAEPTGDFVISGIN